MLMGYCLLHRNEFPFGLDGSESFPRGSRSLMRFLFCKRKIKPFHLKLNYYQKKKTLYSYEKGWLSLVKWVFLFSKPQRMRALPELMCHRFFFCIKQSLNRKALNELGIDLDFMEFPSISFMIINLTFIIYLPWLRYFFKTSLKTFYFQLNSSKNKTKTFIPLSSLQFAHFHLARWK